MTITTYYDTLNVSRKASDREIKRQYRNLAKEYHPDVNPNAINIFKEIVEAYDVLSDSKKRKEYDLMVKKAESEQHNQLTIYKESNISNQPSRSSYDRSIENIEKLNTLVCNEITKLQTETIVDRLDYIANSVDRMRMEQLISEMSGQLSGGYVRSSQRDNCSFETDMYYKNPHKESIFTIIYNWCEYRFENAFSGIWHRNVLAILGALFVYLLSIPFIFINKFLFFLKPSRQKQFGWHWFTHLHYLLYKNDLIATVFWSAFLVFMFVTKLTYNVLYIVYWIFKNILRFFLLPIAIILAAIMRTLLKIMTLNPKAGF